MAIPASEIVQVNPGVLSAAGSAIDLNGLLLTDNEEAPYCNVLRFSNADDVREYFGVESEEGRLATIYFQGYENSTKKPGILNITRYSKKSSAAYLQSGQLNFSFEELQKLSGDIAITIDSEEIISNNISLESVNSFTEAAEIIESALGTSRVKVNYQSSPQSFKIESTTTGQNSYVSYATGTLATSLSLIEGKGAVISAGSPTDTPVAFMNAVAELYQNWALFTTTWQCSFEELTGFSSWASSTNDRFVFAGWDKNNAAKSTKLDPQTVWGAAIKAANYSGSIPTFGDVDHAVFVLGYAASLDFTRQNGRATLAFRRQSGLKATVTNATDAKNLLTNGYNFYGDYATSKDNFIFYYNGQISGKWLWVDSFLNQIWLNANLQLALLNLLMNIGNMPYNTRGYSLVEAACLDPFESAINFGAIRTGVTLSNQQKADIINQAVTDITDSLNAKGYYIIINDAPASDRVERETPSITVYYTDGQSIQRLTVASIAIQ